MLLDIEYNAQRAKDEESIVCTREIIYKLLIKEI